MSFHGLMTHFLLVLNNIQFSGCTTVYLSIHPQKGHLNSFQVLAIMTKPAINI